MIRRAAVAAALALLPQDASAHAFSSGRDLYAQFIEGAGVPLVTPAIILALLPLGLLAGLWRRDGMVQVWPWFIAGLLAGGLAAPLAGPDVVVAAMGVGVVCAVLAALGPDLPRLTVAALAALAGGLAAAVAREGHGFGELPLLIYAGIFLGAHLVTVVPAAAVSATLDRWPAAWLRIGWRVVASWSGAIGLMLLAFQLR